MGVTNINVPAPGRRKALTLTDGATIPVNNIAGYDTIADITLGGNRTMNAPTHSQQGDVLTFLIRQGSGGAYTLSFASGAGAYRFNSAGTYGPTQAVFDAQLAVVPVGDKLQVAFVFDEPDNRWDCVALADRY